MILEQNMACSRGYTSANKQWQEDLIMIVSILTLFAIFFPACSQFLILTCAIILPLVRSSIQ
jgi:hypothetical protein